MYAAGGLSWEESVDMSGVVVCACHEGNVDEVNAARTLGSCDRAITETCDVLMRFREKRKVQCNKANRYKQS